MTASEPTLFVLIRSGAQAKLSLDCLAPLSPTIVAKQSFYSPYPDTINAKDHVFEGGKWAAIFDFFATDPSILERFDYFWFPDDDIETTPENVRRFLDIVVQAGIKLAQPALTPDSYFAQPITVVNRAFTFRRTNFVELMMPLMHRHVLQKILPAFEGRHAGSGLDFFWHELTDQPDRDVAIIDAVEMGHRRPRRTHLKSMLEGMSLDMASEKAATFREFSIQPVRPVVLSGRRINGAELNRGIHLLWLLSREALSIHGEMTKQQFTLKDLWNLLQDQLRSHCPSAEFNRGALRLPP